jgi:GxxExxY protein
MLAQSRQGAKKLQFKNKWEHLMTENEIAKEVVVAAVKIHQTLGPGLLESVYEVVLTRELEMRGLRVERQVPVAIEYEEIRFDEGFRADIIVEGLVILELKSVENMTAVHRKQLQTYLRLTGLKLGLLLNFGAALMKDGIVRAVNGLEE